MNECLTSKEVGIQDQTSKEKERSNDIHPTLQELSTSIPQLKEEEGDQLSIASIIEHFPKRIKTKAQLIGNYIQQGNHPLNWNKKGELLDKGKPIVGSSIQDLLYDAACPRRKYTPNSAKFFYRRLKENGVPEGIVLNANRRNYMKVKPIKQGVISSRKWVRY